MASPRPPISTHVLDTTRGQAAGGIEVTLYKFVDNQWSTVGDSITSIDGRCTDLVTRELYEPARYKLRFDLDNYFESTKTKSMYPYIEIVFDCKEPAGHYHIPVLLNPFGYTTYRGT